MSENVVVNKNIKIKEGVCKAPVIDKQTGIHTQKNKPTLRLKSPKG